MHNIRQIQVIHKALTGERSKLLSELSRLNDRIHKKTATINKISAYQKEYSDGESLQVSKQTPLLHTNLHSFAKKIMSIIVTEEIELNKLVVQRDILSQRLTKMELKIKIMEHFENRVLQKVFTLQERAEARLQDDLASIKDMREDHE